MYDTRKPLKKIQYFTKLFNNICSKNTTEREEIEKKLLKSTNELNTYEMEFLSIYYQKKEIKGNVNMIRYNLLQHLLKNNILTFDIIEFEKQKIRKDVDHDPFRSWKNDRILYPFCYYPYKYEIKEFLKKITEYIRKELNIINKTNKKIIAFDGAQNQGYDHCWIAIYDKRSESQKDTKQIYIGFWKDKIAFGIFDYNLWLSQGSKRFNSTGFIPEGDSKLYYGGMTYNNFNPENIVDFFKYRKKEIFEDFENKSNQ